jgi:hypothetical protein
MQVAQQPWDIPIIIGLNLIREESAPFIVFGRRGIAEVHEAFEALACFREDESRLAQLRRMLAGL